MFLYLLACIHISSFVFCVDVWLVQACLQNQYSIRTESRLLEIWFISGFLLQALFVATKIYLSYQVVYSHWVFRKLFVWRKCGAYKKFRRGGANLGFITSRHDTTTLITITPTKASDHVARHWTIHSTKRVAMRQSILYFNHRLRCRPRLSNHWPLSEYNAARSYMVV